MTRLPVPGSDNGTWGQTLNDFLSQAHASDGSLKAGTVSSSQIQDNAIASAQLADASVTSAKLVDGTIVDGDISDSAGISQSKIASLVSDLSSKVDKSTLTTKGDMYAATAASTLVRIGVGSNNQVLTADSTQTTGLKWAAATDSNAVHKGDLVVNVKDYGAVGDGVTNDADAIKTAIAAGSGGVVYFPHGTYLVGIGGPLTVPDSTALVGTGRGSILKRADVMSYVGIVANSDYATNSTGNSHIVLRGLSFDGNGANQSPAYSEFRHCVELIGVNDALIENCHFYNLSGDGVYVSSTCDSTPRANYSRNIKIVGNHFEETNHARNGISIIDAIGVIISGSTFVNISSATMPGAIDLEPDFANQRIGNLVVSGNSFIGCRQGVVALNGVSATCFDLIIIGNAIRDTNNGGNAIVVSSFSNVSISGNVVHSSVSFGINAVGCSILTVGHNTIYGVASIGIYIVTCLGATITGNRTHTTSNAGIRLDTSNKAAVTSNTTYNWGTPYYGINFITCTDVLVGNNNIDGTGISGAKAIGSTTSDALRGLETNVITAVTTPYTLSGSNSVGTTAPTTGTWRIGERCINMSPAVSQPKAWVCTVSGTPGTWVSEGNL